MTDPETRRIALPTGVELDVTLAGPTRDAADPIIFLHGFPESRRTWRHQIADLCRSPIFPVTTPSPPRPAWIDAPFPVLRMPVLVVWGMRDTALLPVQLEGLDALVADLTVVRVPQAGHFVTWEAPGAVTDAIRGFLAARPLPA